MCKLRRKMMLLLFVLFLLTGCLFVNSLLDAHRIEQINDQAQELVNIPAQPTPAAATPSMPLPKKLTETAESVPEKPLDTYAALLKKSDLSALQTVNPDVIGWILVPDTAINYPLLHTQNNSTYLHTAWDGTENQAGSIFLETRNNPALSDFNTILYGHHMRNGSMFAALLDYQDPAFAKGHSAVYLLTEDGIYQYTVFAAYEASIVSDTYRLTFQDDAQKQAAITSYLQRSQWESPLDVTTNDHILTLSTCTGTGQYETRWVVQAVRTYFWANKKAGSP